MSAAAASSAPTGHSVLLVIVTYKSQKTIPDLIGAVSDWLRQSDGHRLSVIDNSGDIETMRYVRAMTHRSADRVVAEVAPGNAGFANGVNEAVRRAIVRWREPETVILLNPDIVTTAESIAATQSALADPSIGIAAPRVVSAADGSLDRGLARRHWNRRTLFSEIVGAPRLARLLGSRSRNVDVPTSGPAVDVDIVTGAFMAVRFSVFGDGLDCRLPMYLEDQEICHRSTSRGLRVVVLPETSARHAGGHSRQQNSAMQRELRMLELAAAPAQSLQDTAGHSATQLRVLVGVGGVARATVAALTGLLRRDRRRWAADQLRLSSWFVAWAARPNAVTRHDWSTAP
jgi:N-acetylglucosaminyl-diphospho-decaprenol L-rhamnosyltransferase